MTSCLKSVLFAVLQLKCVQLRFVVFLYVVLSTNKPEVSVKTLDCTSAHVHTRKVNIFCLVEGFHYYTKCLIFVDNKIYSAFMEAF